MIGEIRYADGRDYVCDDCGKEKARFKNYDEARHTAGWAVSWERTYCYCPKCAPFHRLGGANKPTAATLPKNGEQLRIGI